MAYMERRGANLTIGNPVIAKVVAEDKKKMHEKMIGRVTAAVDNKDPRIANPSRSRNPKKEAMMEEQYAKIEHDNLMLLKKMHGILGDSGRFSSLVRYGPRSLNINTRRKELERIATANQVGLNNSLAVLS
jgi:uncharacterized Zn finger protein